jgi:hypothetical protein
MVQVAECLSICIVYFSVCNEAAQRIYSPIKGMIVIFLAVFAQANKEF